MIHDTQRAKISQKQDGRNINVIMKTMCPPGYHDNGFAATHALGHMIYDPKCMSCHTAIVVITGRAHGFDDYINIDIHIPHKIVKCVCIKENLKHIIPLQIQSLYEIVYSV